MAQNAVASPSRPPAPEKMTWEEFLEWADAEKRVEWVDGEVVWMSPTSFQHQDLLGLLSGVLRMYAEQNQLGSVLTSPYLMRLPVRPSGREPDILFVRRDREHLVRDTFLDGPADLAIEIVSPESQERDRVDKYREYARGGVREYWLIDPERQEAVFYTLQADGGYTASPVDENGIYRSAVIEGLWLDTNWLWQRPLPTLITVLRAWNLV